MSVNFRADFWRSGLRLSSKSLDLSKNSFWTALTKFLNDINLTGSDYPPQCWAFTSYALFPLVADSAADLSLFYKGFLWPVSPAAGPQYHTPAETLGFSD
jgi:hypothetical protein